MIVPIVHALFGLLWFGVAVWFQGVVPVLAVLIPGAVYLGVAWHLDDGATIRWTFVFAVGWSAVAWLTVGNSIVLGAAAVVAAGFVGYPLVTQRGPTADRGERSGEARGAIPRILSDPNSLVLWVILGVLVAYGFQTSQGTYLYDPMHPLYELSIGNSFARGIFNTPDLSLSGKVLKFHFFSTQMIRLLRALGIAPIAATYFVGPSILAVLVFFSFAAFFSIEKVGRYTAILLFLPVVIVMERSLYLETTFRRFFAVTPSFSLGIILTIAFLYEVVHRKRYLSGWLISIAVLLTKATFFPVIAGGLVLRWLFVQRPQKDHTILPLIAAMGISFVVGWFLFFTGAHSHNHWVVGPSFLYRLVIEGDPIHVVYFLALLGVIAYRIKKGMVEDADWFVMSAVLGTLLIAEITEDGSYQFVSAASPYLLVVVARTFGPRLLRRVGAIVAIVVLLSSIYVLRGFGTIATEKIADDTTWGARVFADDDPPLVSNDVVDAYDALSQSDAMGDGTASAGLVFFSPVYELESAYAGSRFSPDTGFLRSALADRPLYRENFKYKGIAMEPTFITRFGASLFWYETRFTKTDETSRLYQLLLESTGSYERGEPFSPKGPLNRRLIYYAGLGTEWSWFNWRYVALHDSYQHYLELTERSATEVIEIDPAIGVVVAERGDTFLPMSEGPADAGVSSSAESGWRESWASGDVAIWVRE